MSDLNSAVSTLVGIGYRQDEALTKIDTLIKMYGIDRALATVNEMENDFYLKDIKDSIFLGSDGRYHYFMTMPDGKRKHIVAKDKQNIEKKIVKLCKRNEHFRQTFICCMEDIIEDFLRYKEKDASPSTAYRLRNTYDRFLRNSQIVTYDMKDITIVDLKEFCLDQIEQKHLTGKSYRELKSLLNCLFDYAVDLGVVTTNTARQMSKVNFRKFAPERKKIPELQVFTREEEVLLYSAALEMFRQTGNVCYLAIILSGCFGLRAGELVALKEEDFDLQRMELHVSRMEILGWTGTGDKLHSKGVEVVDRLKTDESYRSLPITESAFKVFELIIEYNRSRGFKDGYLFLRDDGTRINTAAFDRALKKANKKAGLIQRSNHKLRKTLLSELEHSIGATKTRAYAGHSRNSVTLERNYLYLTTPLSSESTAIEEIISTRVPDCTDFVQFPQKSEQK